MGAFFKPSEEPGVKRAKRSGATLIPGSSDGTLCAAIAEQMSAVARSLWRKTLSLSPPCGWVHFKLPKWVKSTLALTTLLPFSECPPPNVACDFHRTTLSSSIRFCLSVNVIPCFWVGVHIECPYGSYGREPASCACGKP